MNNTLVHQALNELPDRGNLRKTNWVPQIRKKNERIKNINGVNIIWGGHIRLIMSQRRLEIGVNCPSVLLPKMWVASPFHMWLNLVVR